MAIVQSGQMGMATPFGELLGKSTAEMQAEIQDYKDLGVEWVRLDIHWTLVQPTANGGFQWELVDKVFRALDAAGLKILPILNNKPTWLSDDLSRPQDHEAFGKFATAAVQRYGDIVDHWQIFNEPNKNGVSPEAYTKLLQKAHDAIKAVNPSDMIIAAGNAPVPQTIPGEIGAVEFLERMYAAGAKNYFDAMGYHPYSFPLMPSNGASWNGWQMMEDGIRGTMVANGDAGKQIWITEYGAKTHSGNGVTVSDAQQAAMLREAVALAEKTPWIGPLMWFSYQDSSFEPGFGLLDKNGNRKEAWQVYQDLAESQQDTPVVPPVAPTPPANGSGTDADDVLVGTGQADVIDARGGNDVVRAGAGNDTVRGGDGNDDLVGAAGNDALHGGNGNDTLWGADGNDLLNGDAGNDRLEGWTENDTLNGGAGNDTLNGDAGDDLLNGGTGKDILNGGDGNDRLNGDADADVLSGGAGNDTLTGGDGNDLLNGDAGADLLSGGTGHDTLNGGDGNDVLNGEAGNDMLRGGAGNDRLDGGAGADRLDGGAGADRLEGDAGNDTLSGSSGNDVLIGGSGNDLLIGGADADTFVFTTAEKGDVIQDWQRGDKIDLRGIDANTGLSGDQAFEFIGSQWLSEAGDLGFYVDTANNKTYVQGNVNAGAAHEFNIVLEGVHHLLESDFLL